MLIRLPEQTDRNVIAVVQSSGGVAAGRIVPFPVPGDTLYVPLSPRDAAAAQAGLVSYMTVFGDSLTGVGILDGDKVIVQRITSLQEITDTTICIVLIRNSGDPVAKRVIRRGGMVTLRACNPDVPDCHFLPEEVQIQGRIIGLYCRPDAAGSFKR
jgi:repressor LexA